MSYPLARSLLFRYLRIITSKNLWNIRRPNVYAMSDSRLNPESKVLYLQRYNGMSL